MSVEVLLGDSLELLDDMEGVDVIVTSLPDAAEVGIDDLDEYDRWFTRAAAACLSASTGITIFAQTDRRHDGETYSKAGRLLSLRQRLIWHKIALRTTPGSVDFFRPTYTHVLAFAPHGSAGRATPDVIVAGRRLYPNGMGVDLTAFLVDYARRWGPTFCDPFCGYGTTLAAAAPLYDRVIGIDIDPAMGDRARELTGDGPAAPEGWL